MLTFALWFGSRSRVKEELEHTSASPDAETAAALQQQQHTLRTQSSTPALGLSTLHAPRPNLASQSRATWQDQEQ